MHFGRLGYLKAIKSGDSLEFIHHNNYESRGTSIEALVRGCLDKYPTAKDFVLGIGTADMPNASEYNFSVTDKNYIKAFPCFIFDSYREVGIKDYSYVINSFIDTKPESNKVGWVGAVMSDCRENFLKVLDNDQNDYYEGIVNKWWRNNKKELYKNTPTYLTYQQQIDRWKYLIDFKGIGYSGRTKVLLNSPRIVFIVDRKYEEFWYEHIKPWVHYVPVKEDLSDLEKNYEKIESDTDLQEFIKRNQREFAKKYLTKEAALLRIKKIIEEHEDG